MCISAICLKASDLCPKMPDRIVSWYGRSVRCIKDRASALYQRIAACFRAIFDFIAKPFIRFNPTQKALLTTFQDPTQPDVKLNDLKTLPNLFNKMSSSEQKTFLEALSLVRLTRFLSVVIPGQRILLFSKLPVIIQSSVLVQEASESENFSGVARFFKKLDPKIQVPLFFSLIGPNSQSSLMSHLRDYSLVSRLLKAGPNNLTVTLFPQLCLDLQIQMLQDPSRCVYQCIALLRALPIDEEQGATTYALFNALGPVNQSRLIRVFSRDRRVEYMERMCQNSLNILINHPQMRRFNGEIFRDMHLPGKAAMLQAFNTLDDRRESLESLRREDRRNLFIGANALNSARKWDILRVVSGVDEKRALVETLPIQARIVLLRDGPEDTIEVPNALTHFLCPVTREIMSDPVHDDCGAPNVVAENLDVPNHYLDRTSLTRLQQNRNHACPLTRRPVRGWSRGPRMQQQILNWLLTYRAMR